MCAAPRRLRRESQQPPGGHALYDGSGPCVSPFAVGPSFAPSHDRFKRGQGLKYFFRIFSFPFFAAPGPFIPFWLPQLGRVAVIQVETRDLWQRHRTYSSLLQGANLGRRGMDGGGQGGGQSRNVPPIWSDSGGERALLDDFSFTNSPFGP